MLVLALALVALVAIPTIVQAAYARARGIAVDEVVLFAGPKVARFAIGRVPVVVKLLPVSAYVSLRGLQVEGGAPFRDPAAPRESLASRGLADRLAIAAIGPALVLACALALIGPHAVGHELATALGQIVGGAVHPLTRGAALVTTWLALAHAAVPLALGVLLAKAAAMQVLPVPGSSGYLALTALVAAARGRWSPYTALMTIALLVAFAGMVAWAVAIITALAR